MRGETGSDVGSVISCKVNCVGSLSIFCTLFLFLGLYTQNMSNTVKNMNVPATHTAAKIP